MKGPGRCNSGRNHHESQHRSVAGGGQRRVRAGGAGARRLRALPGRGAALAGAADVPGPGRVRDDRWAGGRPSGAGAGDRRGRGRAGRRADVAGGPVELVLRIDERLRPLVRSDAVARIVSEGLVGAKVVELSPGRPDAPPVAELGRIASERPIEMADVMKRASGVARAARGADPLRRAGPGRGEPPSPARSDAARGAWASWSATRRPIATWSRSRGGASGHWRRSRRTSTRSSRPGRSRATSTAGPTSTASGSSSSPAPAEQPVAGGRRALRARPVGAHAGGP